MAQQIKFNIIKSLFHLFSFLADKTNGWTMFVKPKILLGSVILGLTACSSNVQKQNDFSRDVEIPPPSEQTDTTKMKTEKSDSVTLQEPIPPLFITCYEPVSCYAPVVCYDVTITIIDPDTNYVYTGFEVEQSPEPSFDLPKFIKDNLRYPTVMLENEIAGRVICQIIIEKDGSISNVKVVRNLDPAGDAEAMRIVKSMPNWLPGKVNGQAVRVEYLIPVSFRLPTND